MNNVRTLIPRQSLINLLWDLMRIASNINLVYEHCRHSFALYTNVGTVVGGKFKINKYCSSINQYSEINSRIIRYTTF